jgi:hypothetical protein
MKNKKKTSVVIIGDAAAQLIKSLSKYQQFKVMAFSGKSEKYDACIVASWKEIPKEFPASTILIGIDNPHLAKEKNSRQDISDTLKKDIEAQSGIWIPARAKFRRWGERMFEGTNISQAGWKALARESERAIERGLLIAQPTTPKIFFRLNEEDIDLGELIKTKPELADKLALETIRKYPKNILANLPNSTQNYSAKAANAILNDKIDFGVGLWDSINFKPPLKWDLPGPDRSWHSYLLGLDFLLPPLAYWSQYADPNDANSKTMIDYMKENEENPKKLANDHILLGASITFIIQFINDNPRQNPVHARAWHEGTTSRRLRTLLLAIGALSQLESKTANLPAGTVALLLTSIANHVDVLSHDLNYRPSGNHGLRQDLLLYISAKLFPSLSLADQWAKLARSRLLDRQLSTGVAPDGSWCEHSMSYQRLATNLVRKFCKIAKETGDKNFMNELSVYYSKMVSFQNNLLRSNGTLPSIGDTGVNCIAPKLFEDEFGHHEKVEINDFKSNWLAIHGAKDFHAVFHADLRSPKHKHADDLSFVLFYQGNDWLIDPGALNRELGSDMRDHFCLDPTAHNSWSVNNKGYGFSRSKDFVGLDRHYDELEWQGASGLNERYKDGSVRRTMLNIKNKPVLIIIDYVTSKDEKEVEWASHLHFASDLGVNSHSTHYEVNRKDIDEVLRVQFYSKEEEHKSIIQAQKEPLLGWVMSGWGKAEPSSVLVRKFKAKKRMVVSVIEFIQPDNNSSVFIDLKDDKTAIISYSNSKEKPQKLRVNGESGIVELL